MASSSSGGEKEDQYGQIHPNETPELIEEKLNELESQLDKLSDDAKKNWIKATEKCPDLTGDATRLMFLRCEVFNADVSNK
mmetsp:Transcript_7342/g.10527  ORF Transcript_7342/g.10527 Transcript_7342/m.10527 type:complete len:81 (-) Transcript_7342:82-324(-)